MANPNEKLHDLRKKFDALLSNLKIKRSNLDRLFNLGLTYDEAESWLEENLSSPDNLQGKKSPDKFTEPEMIILINVC